MKQNFLTCLIHIIILKSLKNYLYGVLAKHTQMSKINMAQTHDEFKFGPQMLTHLLGRSSCWYD